MRFSSKYHNSIARTSLLPHPLKVILYYFILDNRGLRSLKAHNFKTIINTDIKHYQNAKDIWTCQIMLKSKFRPCTAIRPKIPETVTYNAKSLRHLGASFTLFNVRNLIWALFRHSYVRNTRVIFFCLWLTEERLIAPIVDVIITNSWNSVAIAFGRPAMKLLGGLELVCGQPTLTLSLKSRISWYLYP